MHGEIQSRGFKKRLGFKRKELVTILIVKLSCGQGHEEGLTETRPCVD